MADTGKRVEVRFGAFACAIEGYDDPVVQMREVLMLMQQMIRETPALADRATRFGDAEVARLEHALDHSEGHGDAAPGIVVIRNAAGEPEDAETVDDLPPDPTAADEAAWREPSGSSEAAPVGEMGPEDAAPGDQRADDAVALAEVAAPASADEGVPVEHGAAGVQSTSGVHAESEPHTDLAARAAGESEPETALPREGIPAAGAFREPAPAPLTEIAGAGTGGGCEPAETDAAARGWPADRDADPAHISAPLAAAAAEAAFSADIAAAPEPPDAFGRTAESADEPAPELAAAADETGEAADGERVAPTGTSDDAAEAASVPAISEPTEPLEAAERQDSAERSSTADEIHSAGQAETVEAVGAPAPSDDTSPAEDVVDAEAASDVPGNAGRADAPAAGPVLDGSGHDAEKPDRPAAPDAARGPTTAGEVGQGQPTTDEPQPEQAATGDGEPDGAAGKEAESGSDAIAAAFGAIGASGAPEPGLADGAAAGEVEPGGREPPPAAGGAADRLALNIFAPPPVGAATPGKASVNLFAPPPSTYAPPRGNAFRNIFAPPTRAAAPAREPAFVGTGPERAPAAHRPTRAASLRDLETDAGVARGSAYSVFAPDHEDGGESAETTPAPASPLRPEAGADDADEPAPATAADSAPAPRRPEGAGRFAALLGRIYGARATAAADEPYDARASVNAAAPDPVRTARGPSAADLAARAGARSVPDLLAASAAWLALVDDKRRFSRREVMEVFETLPGPHERTLEARIKGFGKLVRAGTLILVEEGVFSLSDAESDRYRNLLDRG